MKRSIRWERGAIVTIDQASLPHRYRIMRLTSLRQVLNAIGGMRIRGAPLIGVASGYALALEAYRNRRKKDAEILERLDRAGDLLRGCRPTGRDMHRVVDRILSTVKGSQKEIWRNALAEAEKIAGEYEAAERKIVESGQRVVEDGDVVITHCNSGSLATIRWGTALGVITEAWRTGKKISVIVTETRPVLQGARLTAWELKRKRVPFKLITDSMVGYVMSRGMVTKALVGADRIWRDGSVANKIGTLTIATVAEEYGIPFYVAAPLSTFEIESDPSYDIVEMRDPEEVLSIGKMRIAPRGVSSLNPAFDITPPDRITAIVTERGVIRPPFEQSIARVLAKEDRTC